MTSRQTVDTSLNRSNVLAERITQAELSQQALCDELWKLAAEMDAEGETDGRELVDQALLANNSVAAHLQRSAEKQDEVCTHLMDLAAIMDTPKTTLCPIEPTGEDQTSELLDWYATVDGHVSFGSDLGRTYVVNSIFDVADRAVDISNFSIEVTEDASGDDVSRFDGKSKRRHVRFTNCDVKLDNISVQGQNLTDDKGNPITETQQASWDPQKPFEHGLCFESCGNISVTNYVVDGVFGDGAYFRDTSGTLNLDGFRISRNGRQGVAIISGSGDLTVLNGEILHSRRSGIDLEPNVDRERIENVYIAHMSIRSRLLPITRGGQGSLGTLRIHDIVSKGSSVPRINVQGDHNDSVVIDGWDASSNLAGSVAPIVRVENTDSIVLRNIHAPAKPERAMTAVSLSNVLSATLEDCNFSGAIRLIEDKTGTADVTVTNSIPEHA